MKNNLLNEKGDLSCFLVPENYFENLEKQLSERMEALEAEKNVEVKDKPAQKGFVLSMESIRPFLYMAAMFVLLLFSIALVFKYTSGKSDSLRAQESVIETNIPTAEDYLISSVGTYGISQYYVESQFTN